MSDPNKPAPAPANGTGATLFNIYRNLFPSTTDDSKIKEFQAKAARYFDGPDAQAAFVALLWQLNDGQDPGLSDEQISTFAWFMKMDQNAFTVAPWDIRRTGPQMW